MNMEGKIMSLAWNSIDDGIIVTDPHGIIMDINLAALEMMGIGKQEAMGRLLDHVFYLVDEDTGKALQHICKKTLAESVKVSQYRNVKLVGKKQQIILSVKFSPIQEAGQLPQGVVVVFRDITQVRQHEEKLRLFQMALEQSPFTVVMTDVNNQIVYVNRQFVNATGYEKNEVMGKDPGFLKSGKLSRKTYERMWETITSGKVWQGTFYNRKKNGWCFWEKAIVAPIVSTDGRISNYLAIKEDVTEQKVMEEELYHAREQAEQHLKKSQYYMEQLEKSRRAADTANKAKSEFLANMSHEIRTPLNGMMGMIELTAATDLTQEQQDNLEIIRICGDNLLNVINNVLDFSKIESGKMEIDRVDFEVQEWFRQSLLVHQAAAAKKNILLGAVLDPRIPCFLHGDAKRLQQVMNNLIGNAVKFTEEGHIRVLMDYAGEEGAIVWVDIQVQDTGIGISEQELPRLFRSFTQLDGSITRRFGGTGLGLTISRQLLEMMGGTIGVSSEEGEGTTFTVTLPFEQAKQQPMPYPIIERLTKPAVEKGQSWTILVAEDDPINQTVIKSLLKLKGYRTHCVNDGKAALEVWEKLQPDLILMDIQMPEMDGIQATAAIREREKKQGLRTPIIALTAHAIHGDRERFLASGMDEYVPKPVEMERLYHAINGFLHPLQQPGLTPPVKSSTPEAYGYLPVEAGQLMAEAVEDFMTDMFSLLDRLQEQLMEEDLEQIERLAHEVKGRAVAVGELDIKNHAFKIELAARKNALQDARSSFNDLKKSFESYVTFSGQAMEKARDGGKP